jgi:programmed cell death 6-interacting protein
LRFELANVLFNLAATYSQLASANRSTPDALKTACNYFCLAAGVISHLKTTIIPDMRSTPPEDMDTMTLECIEQLMLAQGQECVWQRAVKDGLKDATIAKLAAKVSDYYAEAGDYGRKSDAISSEWIHHMTAKHHHFAAAAQFRAACDCLEKRKYGEEVARLQDSLACATEALKESRYINKTVLDDLNSLKTRVQEDLKRAEKDNDVIYLLPVPPKSELKTLDRANMVQSRIPNEVSDPVSQLGDNSPLGKPLFTKLVPYAVHVAASIYEDRKLRLVNQTIIEELESMTTRLHELLSSLNLPGSLQAIEKPLGLPPGLVSHAEEIRQQDGINRLRRSREETEKIKANSRNVYQEGLDLLRSESAEDERARRKYGTDQWARPTSEQAAPKLHAQAKEIEGYLSHSESSDDLVMSKFAENESLIKLLGGSRHDLEHFVPSSRRAALTPALEQASNKLRACLNDVGRLETKRKRKIEALRTKVRTDDISEFEAFGIYTTTLLADEAPDAELLKEAARLEREYPMQKIEAAQFESLFEKRLELYDADKTGLGDEETEQTQLTSRIIQTNATFVAARKGDTSTKQREQALQSLENAYSKYKEIISNMEAARKFYNDLAKIVSAFRDECRNFAYQRRADASQIEGYVLISSIRKTFVGPLGLTSESSQRSIFGNGESKSKQHGSLASATEAGRIQKSYVRKQCA